jgi:uncharacterized protein (TIGR03083 family)
MTDHNRLRLEELAAISEFAHGLSEQQWDHPSLCEGWRVRDVISHMCVGYTTPLATTVAKLARRGFDVPRASKEESITFGSTHTPAEILEVFDGIHRLQIRKGITRFIKPTESLVDHVVHHQDMRRPLGVPRPMPTERLRAALEAAPSLGGFVGAKKRAAGLRLVAPDVDWSHGSGPEVQGAGEAVLLALTGRRVALDELSGEGVETLRARVA